MTKHIRYLNNIFLMLRQWWKSRIKLHKMYGSKKSIKPKEKENYIKAPANLCDDRMKFIEALITSLFSSRL